MILFYGVSMPRKKKDEKDLSAYTDKGKYHWKEATRDRGFTIGITSVKPTAQMLSGSGVTIKKYDDAEMTCFDIVYDREYCLDYFYRNLMEGLGFFVRGEFDKTTYEKFSDSLIEYGKSVRERNRREQILKDAKEQAIKYPHIKEEQWIKILSEENMDTTTKSPPPEEDGQSKKKKSA